MRKIISPLLFALPFQLFAQNYSISLIPDSLLKNANAVKRYEELRFEIKEPGRAKVYSKTAYSILNEEGERYAAYATYYDKFHDINYIDGNLFDASGKTLKNVKKKDIEDLSGNDDESLMVDTRFKVHNFYYRSYPYTVEYEEEDDLDGMFDIPDWTPQQSNILSVAYSKFVIVAPKNYALRYKLNNITQQPVITESGDKRTYTWEIKNITAKVAEPVAPKWKELRPSVLVAPSDFEIQGYKGNMSSWENFGIFINSLLKGRDVLPDAVKQQVHQLTDGIKDEKEKIKVLYNFLQQNTRYISVQLGIGGWQPFDANYVFTKRYGDCKALSNYMVAILKEAGLNARYVLIRGGEDENDIITDFPSNQFNHATVCVITGKDSVWLECTSQTRAAGFIGSFTGNRHAILIDEKGGHVVATTRYEGPDNTDVRHISAQLDEAGKLKASVTARYTCMEQEDLHDVINFYPKDKQLEYLKKSIDLPDYDVSSFNYTEVKSEKPYIDEQLELVANNYASVSGKRIFVMPNILSKSNGKFKNLDQRVYPVDYKYAFISIDTVDITIPAGFKVESMPKNVDVDNQFGSYSIRFNVTETSISCTRRYQQKAGRFPASDYQVLVKFFDDMFKADRSKIVFVKKEG